MLYSFICDECGKEEKVKCSMSEISSKEVVCSECGMKMHQKWSSNISVPEHMRAQESQEMSFVKESLKKRPSGKRQVFY